MYKYLTIIFLFCLSKSFPQEFPNQFIENYLNQNSFNLAENWAKHSTFGLIRYHLYKENTLNKPLYRSGLSIQNNDISLFSFININFKNNFFVYTYPRFGYGNRWYRKKVQIIKGAPTQNDKSYFDNQTSGIGFQNDWVLIQVGRGAESWGAGNDIQLALSENSPKYDYVKIGSDYGNLRVCYIHGFLETTEDNFNRYITSKGFEWTNKRSIVVSFQESIIYSGENRTMDIGYLNPLAFHLEAEWNNRLNTIGEGNSNAVWQISLDYIHENNLRVSGNFLFDDLVIDREIENNMQNAIAYSLKINKLYKTLNYDISTYLSLISIGTPTFRHNKYNNFVISDEPLGNSIGSDCKENLIGIDFTDRKSFYCIFEMSHLVLGERNLLFNPYNPNLESNYLIDKFPSGEQTSFLNLTLETKKRVRKNLTFHLTVDWTKLAKTHYLIGFDIFI